MARRAAKAKLPTSATGIPERRDCGAPTVSAVSTARLAKPALAGFSLIELLVVVAIIGIVALVATLSINGSSEHQLQREAERFEALIAQACERAELSGREIGVVVGDGGYAFRLLAGTDWMDLPDGDTLRRRPWIDGLRAELTREGRHVELVSNGASTPQLVCFSSGELTPFALTLELGGAARYRVIGAADATLKSERVRSAQ
jgi:general secretion pathway protein H